MKYLSVCSGIEAATVAWHPLGWEPVAFGEIEKFPSQVLAHHYPDTPNWGDMTKFKEWPDANVNVFVGGTPCQSFSVAGLRKGLDDPRGNLMLTYLAIAAKYRPQWLVWENVPGVLSSNGGHDFASLLRGMGECGYGFAYRILDAQYFGVAQRRRRVFVVGYLGDWQPAAAVLFERHSLSGHPAPSREKREGVAPNAREGSSVGSLCARTGQSISVQDAEQGHLMPAVMVGLQDCNNFSSEITGTIVTREGCAADTAHMVMQPIPIDSMNHIGRGDNHSMGDFVPGAPSYTLTKNHSHAVAQPIAFSRNDDGQNATHDLAPTMRVAGNAGGMLAAAIATHDVAGTMLSRKTSGGFSNSIDHAAAGYMALQPIAYNIAPGKGALKDDIHVTDADATKTLDASGSNPAMHQGGAAIVQPIAFSGQMSVPQTDVDMTQTLQAKNPMAVMQQIGIFQDSEFGIAEYDTAGTLRAGRIPAHQMAIQAVVAPTLTAANDPSRSPQSSEVTQQVYSVLQASMAVRRLSPKECERLQGFPDNYTDIKPKGKATPDGPRYKALGNSMAVPVMAWIGSRIQKVQNILDIRENT